MPQSKSQKLLIAFGDPGLRFISKQLEQMYINEVEDKVKNFREMLLSKRDEVVAGAVLHISKSMDIEAGRDRVIITIKNGDLHNTKG